MGGILSTYGKYKCLNCGFAFVDINISKNEVAEWQFNRDKIPAVILEEKYENFDGKHHQKLSGLEVVYEFRKTGYGGPIVVLSIFNLDQIKTLIKYQSNRFKEKTERILLTSNIGFFSVLNKEWRNQAKIFVEANKDIDITDFSRLDGLRYSTQHAAAVSNILHDLKNALLYTTVEEKDKITMPFIDEISQNHLNHSRIKEFEEVVDSFLGSKTLDVDTLKDNLKPLLLDETDKDVNESTDISRKRWEVLVVEDNSKIAEEINIRLKEQGFVSKYVTTPKEALKEINTISHLVWVIADYRLMDERKSWYPLQGIDLLLKIQQAQKIFHKKVHLTILTSKRDVLARVHQSKFNEITFFNKSLLQSERDYQVFLETQLPHLLEVDSLNQNKFVAPPSWQTGAGGVLALRLNSKEFRSIEDKNRKSGNSTGNDLYSKFKLERPKEVDKTSWNNIWLKITSDEEWGSINEEINKIIEDSLIITTSNVTLNYKGDIKPTAKIDLNGKDWKANIKHRLLFRRLCLAAFASYSLGKYPERNFNKPLKFFNDFAIRIRENSQNSTVFNHFRSASGFEPDEVFSGFELQYKSIPQEERTFLENYLNTISS